MKIDFSHSLVSLEVSQTRGFPSHAHEIFVSEYKKRLNKRARPKKSIWVNKFATHCVPSSHIRHRDAGKCSEHGRATNSLSPYCFPAELFQSAQSISKIQVAIPLAGREVGEPEGEGRAKIIGLPAHFRELSILRPRRISSRIRPDRINTNAQVGAGEIETYGKGASEDKRAWARGNCIPRINLCRGRTPPTFPGRGRLWNFSIYLCRLRATPVLFHIITNGQEELGGRISAAPAEKRRYRDRRKSANIGWFWVD